MELVNRIPVRDGANSANPARPLRGTLSGRQRYPVSSCQTAGVGRERHAAPPPSTARPSPATSTSGDIALTRSSSGPMKGTGAPRNDAPVEKGTSQPRYGFTFIDPVPVTPATLAVIVTVPAATPCIAAVWPGTTPRLSASATIATVVSLLVHIVNTAVSVSPVVAARGHALRVTVLSTITLSGVGLTLTVATDTVSTLTVEVLLLPSIAAVIVVDPVATARTTPKRSTVATVGTLLVQSTV